MVTINQRENLLPEEAAIVLGVKPSTLARWRAKNIGPKFIKTGGTAAGRIYYPKVLIDAWLAAGGPLSVSSRPEHCPCGIFDRPRRADGRYLRSDSLAANA